MPLSSSTLQRIPDDFRRLLRFGLFSILFCSPAVADVLVFTEVSVLPMDGQDSEILRDHRVVVRGEIIERVGPSDAVPIPEGATVISGRDRFLMPGLADMHVHVDHASDLEMYPAYGVTTVLNLRGLPSHLRWRDEIAAGTRFGPTLYTTGDYTDGDPPDMPTMMSFSTSEEIAVSVAEQKRVGYDFIKIYAELSEEQLLAVGEAARREKIAFLGHTSDNYSLETALASGLANFAHGEQAGRYLRDESPEEFARVASLIAASDASVTPNLALHYAMVRMWEDLDGTLDRPESQYLHPAIFQPFRRENNRFVGRSRESYERMKDQVIPRVERLTRALHRAGVPLLVGTDSPVAGSFPGAAVKDELVVLASAGIPAYDVLEAATAEAGRFIARYLDSQIRFGQVREGYRADLLLLDENPLEDVARVDRLSGVVLRGRWLKSSELKERMESRAADFRSLDQAVKAFEQRIFAGEIEAARKIFEETRSRRLDATLFSQYPLFFIGYRYLYGEGGFHPDPDRLAQAVAIYEMYAKTYPEFHSSHYMLGQAYRAVGDQDRAVASFQRALAIHPYDPSSRKALARLQSGEEAQSGD